MNTSVHREKKSNQTGIVPRKLIAEFEHEIPRYWCNNSAFMTHMLNTYTLLVPDNEAYYIRHLRKCADEIENLELVDKLLDFCRQEAEHGVGHKAYWRNLEELGINFRGFVNMVGWFNYKLLEPLMPRSIHLANIVCVEHINAYLGSFYLQRDLLKDSNPKMKLLFYWHFAEEIEHKSVAFEVYEDLYGSYLLRILGATLVFPLFYTVNIIGTLNLLWQDRRLFRLDTWKDCGKFLFKDGALLHTLRNVATYLKPGFNPAQIDDYELAKDFFAQAENSRNFHKVPTH
jgi:predicted metal-dependent hydrolase